MNDEAFIGDATEGFVNKPNKIFYRFFRTFSRHERS